MRNFRKAVIMALIDQSFDESSSFFVSVIRESLTNLFDATFALFNDPIPEGAETITAEEAEKRFKEFFDELRKKRLEK